MTPAVKLLQRHKVTFNIHEYKHSPDHPSYGIEAAEKLGVPVERVFKTLVVQSENGAFATAIIPVSEKLSMKKMASACQYKKVVMAQADDVIRTTGYVLGGVSPLAQKKYLPTCLDNSARNFPTIYISAGRRGLEVELSAADLLLMAGAEYAALTETRSG